MTAADRIAAARALIEPLTGHTPGIWLVSGPKPMTIEGRVHLVVSEESYPAAFVPAWDRPLPGQEDGAKEASANAAMAAASPTLRDAVADLADGWEAEKARADALEAELARWKEAAGAHHVASMKEAQRADQNAVRADALAQENAKLRGENADLKSSVVAFGAVHAVTYAKQFGLPEGHLHPTHYDILEKAGARMVDFTRAARGGTP